MVSSQDKADIQVTTFDYRTLLLTQLLYNNGMIEQQIEKRQLSVRSLLDCFWLL